MPFTLAAINATGNTTAGNLTITGVSNTTNVFVGMDISGPGISNGSWVQSFTSNTITLGSGSSVTATATGVALFGGRVTQTGTDTLNNSTAAPPGFTITDRGLFRIFTCPYNLLINGTLTVDATTASLQNVPTAQTGLTIAATGSTPATLHINGSRAGANNGPMVQPGYWWFGRTTLTGVSASVRATLRLTNTTIITNAIGPSNSFVSIITAGDRVNMLNASGTGIGVSRLGSLGAGVTDFQAAITYCGIWMNVSGNGVSYLGATPVNVDGIEINTNGSGRILLRNYNPSFCNGAFYPGSQIVIISNSWARLINSPLGTDVNSWISNSGGSSGGKTLASVIDFVREVNAVCQDTAGTRLNGGRLYWQPTGTNVTTITTNIGDPVYDFSLQTAQFAGSGTAAASVFYAWKFGSNAGYGTANRNYTYFCDGTTRGAETMTMRASTYGYTKVSQAVPMFGNDAVSVTFTQVSLPTTDKIPANGGAVTGVAFDFVNRVITISGNVTYQGLYDHLQFQLNQIANLPVVDPSTASGSNLTFTTGWSLVVQNGATLSAGGNFTSLYVPTVTINGTGRITAVYSTLSGTSTSLELRDVAPGASYIVANSATKATILYGVNNTGVAQTYTVYFPPGSAGTNVLVARELYGYQRESENIPLVAGAMWYAFIDIPDIGISEANASTVASYTSIDNADKFYDRTAVFRLTEAGIKLGQIATRDGTSIRVEDYNIVVNQSATNVYAVGINTITLKSTIFTNGTKFINVVLDNDKTLTADTNEVLTANFEDANGDSSITILGGDGTFELWKIPSSTATADYETGTKLTSPTIGNERFRFIGVSGFDVVGVDINSNVRRRTSMAKGIYTHSFYVGDQIQLAQSPQVLETLEKVEVMQVDLEAIKGTGFVKDKDSLINIRKKAALAAALSA